MDQPAPSDSLIDELDALQDHVLSELDALDVRILDLIRECTAGPKLHEASVEPLSDAA